MLGIDLRKMVMARPDPTNDLSHSTSTCSKLPPPPSFIYRLKGNVILYIIPKFSILRNYILDKSEDLAFGFPLYFKNCLSLRDHLSSCQQGFSSLKHGFLILSHYQHLWNFFNYCCNFESTYVKVLPFFLNIRMKRLCRTI